MATVEAPWKGCPTIYIAVGCRPQDGLRDRPLLSSDPFRHIFLLERRADLRSLGSSWSLDRGVGEPGG